MQSLDQNSFQGKTVLITGASSGIGAATALAFAQAGANTVLADINNADETTEAIKALGANTAYIKTDVSKNDQVKNMVDFAVDTYGKLDCAFNNAGIIGESYKALDECDESIWDDVIDINLKGIWLCMKYQTKYFLSQKAGAIVNMASAAGLVGSHIGSAYIASKHGVVGLTKAAALEYAKSNIRVNAVCPGLVDTDIARQVYGRQLPRVKLAHPLGRGAAPEEVAASVLWLCSDNASYITGHALSVDGGYVAQ